MGGGPYEETVVFAADVAFVNLENAGRFAGDPAAGVVAYRRLRVAYYHLGVRGGYREGYGSFFGRLRLFRAYRRTRDASSYMIRDRDREAAVAVVTGRVHVNCVFAIAEFLFKVLGAPVAPTDVMCRVHVLRQRQNDDALANTSGYPDLFATLRMVVNT